MADESLDIKINVETATVKQAKEEIDRLKKASNELVAGSEKFKQVESNIKKIESSLKGSNNAFLDTLKNTEVFGVSINKLSNLTSTLSSNITSAIPILKGLTLGFKGLTGQIVLLLASSGIGALLIAFGALVTFLTQTKEGVELLEVAFAKIKGVVEPLIASFAKLGKALFEFDFKGVINSFDGVGQAIQDNVKANEDLILKRRELEEAERNLVITQSELQKEIERLLVQEKNRTLTDQQRLAILDQIDAKEKQKLENDKAIVNQRIALLDLEINKLLFLGKDADEVIGKRNIQQAELNKLETASLKITEDTQNKRDEISQAAEQKRIEANAKRKEEQDKEEAETKAYLERLAALEDQFVLSDRERLQKQFTDRLSQIKGNSEQEVALRLVIKQAEQEALDNFDEQVKIKNAQKRQAEFEEEKQNRIFALETELLTLEEENELRNEKLAEIDEINKEILNQKKQNDLISEEKFQFQLKQIEVNATERANAQILESERKRLTQETAIRNARLELAQSIANGVTEFANFIGEETQLGFVLSKAAGLAQIGVDTATAISGALANAQAPTPDNILSGGLAGIAKFATISASILAAAANAKKLLGGAKLPKPKRLESVEIRASRGTLVNGRGTSTSDSIPALLSNGESVINARSTSMFAPLLSRINEVGGGVRFASGGVAGSSDNQVQAIIDSQEIADILTTQMNQNPVKAFVVEQEITDAQIINTLLNNRATI